MYDVVVTFVKYFMYVVVTNNHLYHFFVHQHPLIYSLFAANALYISILFNSKEIKVRR